jgi:DNA-binding XRE family transcriptional regulator
MNSKRPPKKPTRSRADVARLRELRKRFQEQRPSLAELVASGDYTEAVPQSDLLTMLELAAAIKSARKERHLSLTDVAKRSGIDKAALSRIENGQNVNPTIGTIETIARAIGSRLRFQLELVP